MCGDDGRSLASRNSLLLLSHYGGSVSYANYPNLMSASVLAAMHMVDPNSFFFADGKLQAQTETLVFASTGGALELAGNLGRGHHSYGCNVKELVRLQCQGAVATCSVARGASRSPVPGHRRSRCSTC